MLPLSRLGATRRTPGVSARRWGSGKSTNPGCERESMATSDENDAFGTLPVRPRQAWPLAAMAIAVLVNVLWIGALGYALITLL